MNTTSETLNINNREYPLTLNGNETLLEILRDQLGLTGTKTACAEAECGSCTVLMDGKSILSCITLAKDCIGQKILTIEGLADEEILHPVQQAFLDKGAVQCGFCIPGMILSSKALLDAEPHPSTERIREALDGHICRCAGYLRIIEAVQYAGDLISQDHHKDNPDHENTCS